METVVETIGEEEGPMRVPRILTDSINIANSKIVETALENDQFSGMGTTVVVCTVVEGEIHIANVGDSRAYGINDGIEQITIDHSYVEELFREGKISEEDKETHPQKNLITRAMGIDGSIEVDVFQRDAKDYKYLLLCSDGLTNMLCNQELLGIVKESASLEEKADRMVLLALEKGGLDNITLILIEL